MACILTVVFDLNYVLFQAKFYTDMPSETVSKIHLVDLAGRLVTVLIQLQFITVFH